MDLFSYPKSAGYKETTTSKQSADDISTSGRVGRLQGLVYAALERAGDRGLTADEAALILHEDKLSIRPRFSELSEMGRIFKTDLTRKNVSGKAARVWTA